MIYLINQDKNINDNNKEDDSLNINDSYKTSPQINNNENYHFDYSNPSPPKNIFPTSSFLGS